MSSTKSWRGARIYTVGHSTRTLDELVALLGAFDISVLIDIRTIPRSRHNPQFNGDALALFDRPARRQAFTGSEHERWALRHAYGVALTVNFPRSILEVCSQALAVSKLPGITWCDLGSPERVVNVLTGLGVSTPWLATYTA